MFVKHDIADVRHFIIIALLLVASACGSGGGGGGGGGGSLPAGTVTDFQGPLSTISTPVVVAPRYAHMQFDGVQSPTTSSGPNAPGDLRLDINPAAGTVGINRSANRDPRIMFIDFDDDSQAFDSGSFRNLTETTSATLLIPGQASGYDYTSYGVWSRKVTSCFIFTCGSTFFADAFYFGSPTSSSQMPSAGTATFNGTMQGYYAPFTQSAVNLDGDAILVADFSAARITGSFHDISTSTILGSGVSSIASININAQISGGTLSGTVSGGAPGVGLAGGIGEIDGRFFGPSAQEVGGDFRLTGSTGTIIGAFAAKQ